MRFLARRGLSEYELSLKLRRAGCGQDETADAVAECRRLGFLDDGQYARDCAALYASRGCGNRTILLELRRRGVSAFADDAIAGLTKSEDERALEYAQSRLRLLRRETDAARTRDKLYRSLLSRGFAPDVVREATAEALRRSREDRQER